jgi:hypothetical protein
MKLVEDVIPITRVATRKEIIEWKAARRAVLTELLEHEQLVLVDVEWRAT